MGGLRAETGGLGSTNLCPSLRTCRRLPPPTTAPWRRLHRYAYPVFARPGSGRGRCLDLSSRTHCLTCSPPFRSQPRARRHGTFHAPGCWQLTLTTPRACAVGPCRWRLVCVPGFGNRVQATTLSRCSCQKGCWLHCPNTTSNLASVSGLIQVLPRAMGDHKQCICRARPGR
jgi:hypothetical protein